MSGRVIDVLGRPVAGANVHAVSSAGASHIVKTDKDGRYRVDLGDGGAYSIVFAHHGASAQKSISVEPAFNRNGSRYRDCSRPNLELLDSLPWIDRPAR